jgi:2-keto-4-pentenoate hydratase/2-oxohepta-3-ene-1,7-dioic acid hydratase in catechol pathway
MYQANYDVFGNTNLKVANIRTRRGVSLALAIDKRVLDVRASAEQLGIPVPYDIDDLLQCGLGQQLLSLRDRIREDSRRGIYVPESALIFAPIVMRPEKILCVGFNYKKHAEETNTPIPEAPPLFAKYRNSLNQHNGVVPLPVHLDTHFDFETELVIVIGKEGRGVSEEAALDYVAGYTVGNDISARTLQFETSQLTAGKIADGFAPVGPWLVSKASIADPNNLTLQTRFNGETRQDWNTSDMIFNCKRLIAYCSSIATLRPGDVIFTGTPQGVILGEKKPAEERRWIRPGDEVVSTIEDIGTLRVTFREREAD